MKVKLVRKDHKDPEPFESVILDVGKHILGRAPPLNCGDPNISRKHCTLEVHNDGKAELTSTHVNHVFYFPTNPTPFSKPILKKGENVVLNNGDLISFLPDTFLYSVSFITDNIQESNGSENIPQADSKVNPGMEAETQEVNNKDQEQDTSTKVQTDARTNAEHEEDSTLNLSDTELVSFDGFDDAEEEGDERSVPSPSLLDEATPGVSESKTSDKRELNKGDAETSDKRELNQGDAETSSSPSPKRHRPNSPEDVKPDISKLQASISTEPATSSVKQEPQDGIAPVKVKTEAQDGAAGVKVKDEDGDGDGGNPAIAGGSDDKAKPATNRTKCSFGASCYRKNPQHRDEYSHPGDPEWATPTPCQWGAACYRQNPQHRSIFSHPGPPAPRPAPQPAQGLAGGPRIMRVERHGNVFNITANAVNFYDDHFEVEDFNGDSADYDYEF